jgi:hypothetical protein
MLRFVWFGNQEIAMPKFYIDFSTTRRSPPTAKAWICLV